MKNYILNLLVILFITPLLAYSGINGLHYKKAKEYCWVENNIDDKWNEVDDKWKNEDAVILYQEQASSFTQYSSYRVKLKFLERDKIFLRTQTAVNKFKEITLDFEGAINYSYGVRVKKYGSTEFNEIIFDETNTVKDYKSVRLALPNLEVNDIIEIFSFNVIIGEQFKSHSKTYRFGEQYPIQKLCFQVDLESKCLCAYYYSKEQIPQVDKLKNDDPKFTLWGFETENIKPIELLDVVRLAGQDPYIRFEVFNLYQKNKNYELRFPEKGEILDHIPESKISNIPTDIAKEGLQPRDLLAAFKKAGGETLSKKEQAELLFYLFDIRGLKVGGYHVTNLYWQSDKRNVSKALSSLGINHDIILIPRHANSVKEATSPLFYYIIRAEVDGEYIYSQSLTSSDSKKEVYAANVYPGTDRSLKLETLPETPEITKKKHFISQMILNNENIGAKKIVVNGGIELSPEISEIRFLGGYKKYTCNQYSICEYPAKHREILKSKYILPLLTNKERKLFEEEMKEYDGIEKDKYTLKFETLSTCMKEELSSFINNYFFAESDTTDMLSFSEDMSAEYNVDPYRKLSYSYTIDNPVRKMGSDYIISLKKMLLEEYKMDELKKVNSNIQFSSPYINKQTVKLTIPEGYQIVGGEELKKFSSDTDVASLEVEILKNGNDYNLTVTKTLKRIDLSPTEWKEWIELNTQAFNLTQQELLLSKK